MKLSEFKDDAALDLIADIIEPATEILADPAIKEAFSRSKMAAIKVAIKNHKSAIKEIIARLDGKTPEECHFTALSLPVKLLSLLNDPDLQQLFMSSGQMEDATACSSASESTKE